MTPSLLSAQSTEPINQLTIAPVLPRIQGPSKSFSRPSSFHASFPHSPLDRRRDRYEDRTESVFDLRVHFDKWVHRSRAECGGWCTRKERGPYDSRRQPWRS